MAIPGFGPPYELIKEEEKRCANLSGVTLDDYLNNRLPENNADNKWKKIFAKVVYFALGDKEANKFNFFPKPNTYEFYAEKAVREEYENSPDISKELMRYRKASLKYIDDICDGKTAIKPTIGYNVNWDIDFKNKLYNLCSKCGGCEVDRYLYFLSILLDNKEYYDNFPFRWDCFEEIVIII